jgi:hypothetical protein
MLLKAWNYFLFIFLVNIFPSKIFTQVDLLYVNELLECFHVLNLPSASINGCCMFAEL